MRKVGGGRNFGYGKRMAWAGKQALLARYGHGHYGTVSAHAARWAKFAAWAKEAVGVRDAREVTREVVAEYGAALSGRVSNGTLSVAYAQNLLSSVNVVLEALRGDRKLRLAPVDATGVRDHVRQGAPAGLDREAVRQCADALRTKGHTQVAAVVELARELGLRLREASMLDARVALRQATTHNALNITAGTKGGRGHHVDRWLPISAYAREILERVASAQGTGRNLIPEAKSWREWNTHVHHVWNGTREAFALGKLHDLRAAYACERYHELTGHPAPAVAGTRQADKATDRAARAVIARELGHDRADVVSAYIGSAR